MRILTVRNVAQAALFQWELKGQISDGHWENARPFEHYKVWCDCEVRVGPEVGRNFSARRDSYNFSDSDLLEILGPRMLVYARLANAFGWEVVGTLEQLFDLNGEFRGRPTDDRIGQYWDDIRALVDTLGPAKMAEIERVAKDASLYDWLFLLRDLNDLKKIVKIAKLAPAA